MHTDLLLFLRNLDTGTSAILSASLLILSNSLSFEFSDNLLLHVETLHESGILSSPSESCILMFTSDLSINETASETCDGPEATFFEMNNSTAFKTLWW